jgi:hypothetical protein
MSRYSFPGDLVEVIQKRWRTTRDSVFKLPERQTLQTLLETCYHASLRTNEQRGTRCGIAYISPKLVQTGALRFRQPIVMNDAEIVRLSPAAKHRYTAIGCQHAGDGLEIWGLFDHGLGSIQQSIGDPPGFFYQLADYVLDCLTVTLEGPGDLAIAQGRTSLVRLRHGKTIFPNEEVLKCKENPLGRYFYQLVNRFPHNSSGGKHLAFPDESAGQQTLLGIYTTSILAVLSRIRAGRHGGSMVISRQPFRNEMAQISYSISDQTSLLDEMLAYRNIDNQLGAPEHLNGTNEWDRIQAQKELLGASRRLIRGISRISQLAAVDGAVLLDEYLRIQGFGVKFPLLLAPGEKIFNETRQAEYLCDQWGLRHQSIFSICQQHEDAVGFIVSQDGGVKAVIAESGKLHLWDRLLD